MAFGKGIYHFYVSVSPSKIYKLDMNFCPNFCLASFVLGESNSFSAFVENEGHELSKNFIDIFQQIITALFTRERLT